MRSRHAIVALLILIPGITLFPLFSAEFTNWDDPDTVAQCPAMHAPAPDAIAGFWTDWSNPQGHIYIPFTRTVWRMIAGVSRIQNPQPAGPAFNPTVFHVANVLIHIATVFVVYGLLRLLITHAWAACLGALVFGLHPVQVEATAWVSGTKDLLAGLFSLLAMFGYVSTILIAREPPAPGQQRASSQRWWLHYILGTIALLLALFSKPSAIVVPVLSAIVGLFAYTVPRQDHKGTTASWLPISRAVLLPLLPWFVIILPFVMVTAAGQRAPDVPRQPLPLRPLVAADALAFYVGKVAAPVTLTVDYGRTPAVAAAGRYLAWTWCVPLGVLAFSWIARKRAPFILAAIAVFFVAPLPVLGLVPFDYQFYSTVADHYLYVAMFGPALLAAALLARYWGRVATSLTSFVLLAWAILSWNHAGHWQNTFTLFEHNLRVNSTSFAAHRQLGLALAARGDSAGAAAHYEQALRLRPDEPITLFNFGNLMLRDRRPADAVALYSRAASNPKPNPKLLNNLGIAHIQLGQLPEARRAFENAVRLEPKYADAQLNLGLTFEKLGDPHNALIHLRRALEINPRRMAAHTAIQRILSNSGPLPPAAP